MDLYVYMTEDQKDDYLANPESLIWHEKSLIYGDWSEGNNRHKVVTITPTEKMQNNGTIWAHIFFTKPNKKPVPNSKDIILQKVVLLNKYLPKPKEVTKKNLITGEEETVIQTDKSSQVKELVSYWKGNLTLNLLQDHTEYKRGSVPPPLAPHFEFDNYGNYKPSIFVNEFWLMREHLSLINDTVKSLPLDMTFEPISLMKFSFYVQMEESFNMQKTMFGAEEGESEELKRMLMDNHPAILILTMIVSTLHTVFDTLAFKNDIQFWRKKKSMEGLSVRTLYINLISNVIIFLYLIDNETSWLVLGSVGVGLLIEGWKVTRAVHVSVHKWKGLPYIKLADKNSYSNSTKQHDIDAMKYLSWALYPLLLGYAVYSVLYETHKSWYSWVVSTAAGFIYTFGFIAMTPQLFINYKRKSVAHLPWRALIYRALNTFIDDLFAFIIRMPTMHRLKCFRDDIVFLIYLYQRWIYPVDNSRIETFGEGDDEVDGTVNKDTTTTLETAPQTDGTADNTAAVETKKDK